MASVARHLLGMLLLVSMINLGMGDEDGTIDDPTAIADFLDYYNTEAPKIINIYSEASWTFNTNITTHNQKVMLEARLASDKFAQKAALNASQYNLTVMNTRTRRQFIKIMDIGTAAQRNETKLKRR